MFSDRLTSRELDYIKDVIEKLEVVEWAKPVLKRLRIAGGLLSENMPLLFEIRFAYELHKAGFTAEYEFNAGVGNSTVEFRVCGSQEWLIELVSIRPSQGIKNATRRTGMIYEQLLSTNSSDIHQSEEAEMIKVEEKIGEKAFTNGGPTKFPVPNKAFHMIVTDMRGYLIHRSDKNDYDQMAYGAKGVNDSRLIHYWQTESGSWEPIKGLYEKSNLLKAAPFIQERIHFLGFVREKEYREGEISEILYSLANWNLFPSQEKANQAYQTFPLRKKM